MEPARSARERHLAGELRPLGKDQPSVVGEHRRGHDGLEPRAARRRRGIERGREPGVQDRRRRRRAARGCGGARRREAECERRLQLRVVLGAFAEHLWMIRQTVDRPLLQLRHLAGLLRRGDGVGRSLLDRRDRLGRPAARFLFDARDTTGLLSLVGRPRNLPRGARRLVHRNRLHRHGHAVAHHRFELDVQHAVRREIAGEHRASAAGLRRLFDRGDAAAHLCAGGNHDPVVRVDRFLQRRRDNLAHALHGRRLGERDAQRTSFFDDQFDGCLLRARGAADAERGGERNRHNRPAGRSRHHRVPVIVSAFARRRPKETDGRAPTTPDPTSLDRTAALHRDF